MLSAASSLWSEPVQLPAHRHGPSAAGPEAAISVRVGINGTLCSASRSPRGGSSKSAISKAGPSCAAAPQNRDHFKANAATTAAAVCSSKAAAPAQRTQPDTTPVPSEDSQAGGRQLTAGPNMPQLSPERPLSLSAPASSRRSSMEEMPSPRHGGSVTRGAQQASMS